MKTLFKLTSLPTFLRFSLCLLFSAGVHGGVALYGWVGDSADLNGFSEPLWVSLRAQAPLPLTHSVNEPDLNPKSFLQSAVAKTPDTIPAKIRPERPVARLSPSTTTDTTVAVPVPVAPLESSGAGEQACVSISEGPLTSSAEISGKGPGEGDARSTGSIAVLTNASPTLSVGEGTADPAMTGPELMEARPHYRSNPLPEYPYLARQKRWEGVVWLRVDVSAEGDVDSLVVEQSCGYRTLDRSALRAVQRWQFTPATRAGLPISSQVRIPVRFRLEES